MPALVILGSLNMDLIGRVRAMPAPGETILGGEFLTLPGGKGANQAVAAARLATRGTTVHMIGRVGDDDFGRQLLDGLRKNGVRTEHVTVTPSVASGVAMILVDAKGENSIVVAPGANAKLTPADVEAAQDLIRSAAAVVMQLEIPPATVRHAIALCRRWGVYTILDPAPVPPKALPRAMFGVDLLTPNEHEARSLVGGRRDAKSTARRLLDRGAKSVVLKLGHKGSMAIAADRAPHPIRAFKVRATDTTAAGDAFTAALAVGRAEGMSLEESARFANAAGALCCQTLGAQPALPHRAAVERFLKRET